MKWTKIIFLLFICVSLICTLCFASHADNETPGYSFSHKYTYSYTSGSSNTSDQYKKVFTSSNNSDKVVFNFNSFDGTSLNAQVSSSEPFLIQVIFQYTENFPGIQFYCGESSALDISLKTDSCKAMLQVGETSSDADLTIGNWYSLNTIFSFQEKSSKHTCIHSFISSENMWEGGLTNSEYNALRYYDSGTMSADYRKETGTRFTLRTCSYGTLYTKGFKLYSLTESSLTNTLTLKNGDNTATYHFKTGDSVYIPEEFDNTLWISSDGTFYFSKVQVTLTANLTLVPLQINSASFSVNDQFGLNFKTECKSFVKSIDQISVVNAKGTVYSGYYDSELQKFIFPIENITAEAFDDAETYHIRVQIDNVDYDSVATTNYSIKKYITNMYGNSSSSDTLKELLVAISLYGQYAGCTDLYTNLQSELKFSEVVLSSVSLGTIKAVDTTNITGKFSVSAELKESVSLIFETTQAVTSFTCGDVEGTTSDDGKMIATISSIPITEVDELIPITIVIGEKTYTGTYSLAQYLNAVINNSESTDTNKNTARATIYYFQKISAYLKEN